MVGKHVAGLFVLIYLGCSSHAFGAAAAILMYPSAVILDEENLSGSISLINRGDARGVFQIDWQDLGMTPKGNLTRFNPQPEWSLRPFLRFSPRRVSLDPGESQIIKFMVDKHDGIPEGEFHSHLRTLLLVNDADRTAKSSSSDSVSISPRSAMAVPVIWRHSEQKPAATFSAIKLNHDNSLSITLKRQGILSTRGRVGAYLKGRNGSLTSISDAVEIAIYPTINNRTLQLPLSHKLSASDTMNKELVLRYVTDDGSDSYVLAETAVNPRDLKTPAQ